MFSLWLCTLLTAGPYSIVIVLPPSFHTLILSLPWFWIWILQALSLNSFIWSTLAHPTNFIVQPWLVSRLHILPLVYRVHFQTCPFLTGIFFYPKCCHICHMPIKNISHLLKCMCSSFLLWVHRHSLCHPLSMRLGFAEACSRYFFFWLRLLSYWDLT